MSLNTWTSKSSSTKDLSSQSCAASLNGKVYVLSTPTDSNGNPTGYTMTSYDPVADTWTYGLAIPSGWKAPGGSGTFFADLAMVAANGLLWVINDTGDLLTYTPSSNTWATKAVNPAKCDSFVPGPDGNLYRIGALDTNSGSAQATVYAYSISANTWTQVPSMPGGASRRLGSAVCVGADGLIYVLGGNPSNSGGGTVVYSYNTSNKTWNTKNATVATAAQRAYAGSAILGTDALIYWIGGQATFFGGNSATLSRVDVYNPATDTFTTAASLPAARYSPNAALVGQTIIVPGGTTSGTGQPTYTAVTNSPPNAPTPTGPANNAKLDRTQPINFGWIFSDPDSGDYQTKYDYRASKDSGSTFPVSGSGTTATTLVAAANTFSAGAWQWQTRTYDSQNVPGQWMPAQFFTAYDPPVAPTFTSPAAGSTVTTQSQPVKFTHPDALSSYTWRVVGDLAGNPDPSTVIVAPTTVSSPGTSPYTFNASPLPNSKTEHVQAIVTAQASGLSSPTWADLKLVVAYNPPPAAVGVLTTVHNDAADPGGLSGPSEFLLSWTTPNPNGSQVAATSVSVQMMLGNSGTWTTLISGQPLAGSWPMRTPASDLEHAFRLITAAANGTTTVGPTIDTVAT